MRQHFRNAGALFENGFCYPTMPAAVFCNLPIKLDILDFFPALGFYYFSTGKLKPRRSNFLFFLPSLFFWIYISRVESRFTDDLLYDKSTIPAQTVSG